MRIVGGQFSGRALASVGKGDDKNHLRPTTDRVRESLFNVLEHGDYPDFDGAFVLDLFAGTGALGLEALSRGAREVVFVEKGRAALSILRKNVELLGCADRVRILSKDATRIVGNSGAPVDICFLDPPYGKGLGHLALERAHEAGWFGPESLIVFEEGHEQAAPEGFELRGIRKYGDTIVHLLRLL